MYSISITTIIVTDCNLLLVLLLLLMLLLLLLLPLLLLLASTAVWSHLPQLWLVVVVLFVLVVGVVDC